MERIASAQQFSGIQTAIGIATESPLLDRPVQRGPIDLGERSGLSNGELGHTILIPHYLPNNRYTT
jgi:hypothetical protein